MNLKHKLVLKNQHQLEHKHQLLHQNSLENKFKLQESTSLQHKTQNQIKEKHKASHRSRKFLSIRMEDKNFKKYNQPEETQNENIEENSDVQNNEEQDEQSKDENEQEKSVSENQIIFNLQSNEHFIKGDAKQLELEKFEFCQLKQGYLAMIQFVKQGDSSKKIPTKLTAKPVFAVLNSKLLAIFDNDEDSDSVIKTINLQSIGPPIRPKAWENYNCFQLVKDEFKSFQEPFTQTNEPVHEYDVALCAETSAKRDQWITAFDDFHNCLLEELKPTPQLSVDTIKAKFDTPENRELDQLDYKKSEMMDEFDNKDTNQIQVQTGVITDELEHIRKKLIQKKQEQQIKQRKIDEKIKEEAKKTEDLENQEKCVLKMLSIRDYEQSRLANELLKEEEVSTEKTQLEKAEEEIINKVMENETKQSDNDSKIIEDEKLKQQRIKDNLVQLTLDQEKELDGIDKCYSEQLQSNTDNEIKSICGSFIKQKTELDLPNVQQIVIKCLNRKTFCNYCCNYHLGTEFVVKRQNCNDKCSKQIDQSKPQDMEAEIAQQERFKQSKQELLEQTPQFKQFKLFMSRRRRRRL